MLGIDYQVSEIKRELHFFRNKDAKVYLSEYGRKTIPDRELNLMELVLVIHSQKELDKRFEGMKEAKKL